LFFPSRLVVDASQQDVSFEEFGIDEQLAKSNFIIIMADDPGYGNVGAYRLKTIKTPRIDKQVQENVFFFEFPKAYYKSNIEKDD